MACGIIRAIMTTGPFRGGETALLAIALGGCLLGCDDKQVRPAGAAPPSRGTVTSGAAPAPGSALPAGDRPITYHDLALRHIGKGSPNVQIWAITLLVTGVPELTLERVRGAIGRVLGEDVAARVGEPVRSGPVTKFDAPTDKYLLSVEAVKRPYPELDAIELMPLKILDPAVFAAFGEHRAFIAIEMIPLPRATRGEAYSVLGRLAAEFLDDTVVCVHCRSADVYLKAGDEVARVLRGAGAKPVLDFFMDRRVMGVPPEDAAMKAGIEEARRRLPEFLEVWRTQRKAGTFLVKARFETNGSVEYMWLVPTAITDTSVTGALENRPMHAVQWREGDTLTVPMDTVADWAYAVPGRADGGFTDPMIRAVMELK